MNQDAVQMAEKLAEILKKSMDWLIAYSAQPHSQIAVRELAEINKALLDYSQWRERYVALRKESGGQSEEVLI